MIITGKTKKNRKNNAVYSVITVILIFVLFMTMISSFFIRAEDDAYEMLHMQTKQIKDDLILQIKSDRENLVTMANFASRLYLDDENYDIMFDSFKPIGLISNIGILKSDNTFVTKNKTIALTGKISFEEEVARGVYITGRVPDLTGSGTEIIRSAVPIKVREDVVGILYGVIPLSTIGEKYIQMAKELDAQLFVYDKETGKFVIDTINESPGELSQFKDRQYNAGYSYEELVNADNGYTSFKSIFTDENLYVHYSTIEDFDWGIMLARYETQVFRNSNEISQQIAVIFIVMIVVMVIYLQLVLKREKDKSKLSEMSSTIRKKLLEADEQYTNITRAMKKIVEFSGARSAVFADTDGEFYHYTHSNLTENLLNGNDRRYFLEELFQYAEIIYGGDMSAINFMQIVPNKHLKKVNPNLYHFLVERSVKNISCMMIIEKNNHISLLGVIDSKKKTNARKLMEDVAICFSIAMYNKKHLKKTQMVATTDALTGTLNRVAFKSDSLLFDTEMPEDFSCIYVDVNELHIQNNKYGHAAGDEMLVYIANTIKGIFFGQSVYRMGGDEFVIFVKQMPQAMVKLNIERFMEQLNPMGYSVSVGMSFRSQNINCEEMMREAEARMYEAKALYYQNKEQSVMPKDANAYVQMKTGIKEVDIMLSVLKEHYNGIYRVSFKKDTAYRILTPAYLDYDEDENQFSKWLSKYIAEIVHPDYRRAVMSFLHYDVLERHILEGKTPAITYKKMNDETVMLRIFNLSEGENEVEDTLWIFSKS